MDRDTEELLQDLIAYAATRPYDLRLARLAVRARKARKSAPPPVGDSGGGAGARDPGEG